jgi:hypothetical protein
MYLLWSGKHGKWWAPDGYGYTDDRDDAGRFTLDEALRCITRSADSGDPELVTRMVYEIGPLHDRRGTCTQCHRDGKTLSGGRCSTCRQHDYTTPRPRDNNHR